MPGHAPPTEPTDSELVERCLGQDPEAWELLVRRYRRLVYSVPARMGLSPQDMDEVFQDTYATLLERLDTVRDRARVGLWLAVTARRKALDRVTRGPAGREVGLGDRFEQVDGTALAVDELLRLERQHAVRGALEALPERCRSLIEALYYEDPPLSYKEIARRLGVPIGSLGPTRARCMDRLRRHLGEP